MNPGAPLPRIAAYACLMLAMVVLERAWGRRVAGGRPLAVLTDQLMSMGTLAALACGLFGSALLQPAAITPAWLSLVLGAVIGLLGLLLRGVAMRALGRQYTLTPTVEAEQVLITSGPYRVVRHPGYAGILLTVLGLEAIAGTWLALASTLFIVCAVPVRVWVEEQMLLEHFGDAYVTYRTRTRSRLLPGLF